MHTSYDSYWASLVDRVHVRHEVLTGAEDAFYRMACIYGESMVDGIEAYFDRRYSEFDRDMAVLDAAGFSNLAAEYRGIRAILFGAAPLTAALVESVIQALLNEEPSVQATQAEIDVMYDRVIPQLDLMADYRDQFGIKHHLYERLE